MSGFRDGGCLARRRGKSVVALLIVVSILGVPSVGAQEPGAAPQYNGIIIENVTLIDGTGRPPVAGVSV